MDWLHWYDFITPTHPFASIFFGVLVSIIAGVWIWAETRETKSSFFALFGGVGTTLMIVVFLYYFGFYSV